jgi:CRISPR-associated protein (TIGR02584 family)
MMTDLRAPEAYPRRVLLAVTGLTPQVVTETLYALAVARKPAFVPTEILLITTAKGEVNARLSLLSEDSGWFNRLRQEFALPEIIFNEARIRVIAAGGNPLADIVTDKDSVAVADFVTEQVRAITADPGASLHVSIAGGRKTMGFYLGYALSLFGRPQDRLSRVLVSPPFESRPDFYYPASRERVILDRDGRPLDASKAQVRLVIFRSCGCAMNCRGDSLKTARFSRRWSLRRRKRSRQFRCIFHRRRGR